MLPSIEHPRRSLTVEMVRDLQPPLFTALSVVCKQRKELASLNHVVQLIDNFLDSACDRWTLENVSSGAIDEWSLVRLLDLLLTQDWSGAEFSHVPWSERLRMTRCRSWACG